MHRECRKRFPRHRHHRKQVVSDPGMHHDTCVKHVTWYMSGSLTRGGGENFPGACATRNFMYLARGPWRRQLLSLKNAPCNACGHDMETFLHYSTFVRRIHRDRRVPFTDGQQATGLDAWASRVKCPARFVSHLHEICIYIYIYELFIAFVSFDVCSFL